MGKAGGTCVQHTGDGCPWTTILLEKHALHFCNGVMAQVKFPLPNFNAIVLSLGVNLSCTLLEHRLCCPLHYRNNKRTFKLTTISHTLYNKVPLQHFCDNVTLISTVLQFNNCYCSMMSRLVFIPKDGRLRYCVWLLRVISCLFIVSSRTMKMMT